jgi:hypothetical protein
MPALRRLSLPALLLALALSPALAQAPAVRETTDEIAVSNAHYQAIIGRARGGMLSSVTLADGTLVLGGDMLYTDQGVYAGRTHAGTDKEPKPAVSIRRDAEAVVVESRGTLRDGGALTPPERRLDYTFTCTFDASPTIHVRWTATPNFTVQQPSGFFSYLVHVPTLTEWFAKTVDGVIYQAVATRDARSYQSAEEPLDFDDPWVGVVLPNGAIVAWSGIRGSPMPANVFFHESGTGSAGMFCAWLCGGSEADLKAGEPWLGQFDLHIISPSVRAGGAVPAFLR